jgi:hypothetical protein
MPFPAEHLAVCAVGDGALAVVAAHLAGVPGAAPVRLVQRALS